MLLEGPPSLGIPEPPVLGSTRLPPSMCYEGTSDLKGAPTLKPASLWYGYPMTLFMP